MSRQMLSFFDKPDLQLLLFGGKGGVGKTTCATAAALHLSLSGALLESGPFIVGFFHLRGSNFYLRDPFFI